MLASGPPEISDGGKTVTVHIKPRRALQPAGQPRSDLRRRRLRDRARRQPERREPLLQPTSATSSAPRRPGGPIAGHHTPNKRHDRLPPHQADGGDPARWRAGAADQRAGAGVLRRYDCEGQADQYGNYQVATGPYMLKSNAGRQGPRPRLSARQVGDAGAQPQLEPQATDSGPPTWTRSTSTSAATHRSSAAGPEGL
jgi:hypothetical protein